MERRRHERYRLWIPVEIESDDGSTWPGVIHDVSELGVLAVTSATFKVGAHVTLSFLVPPDGKDEQTLRGAIARVGVNAVDRDSLWKKGIAVELEEPIPGLDALRRLGEKMT